MLEWPNFGIGQNPPALIRRQFNADGKAGITIEPERAVTLAVRRPFFLVQNAPDQQFGDMVRDGALAQSTQSAEVGARQARLSADQGDQEARLMARIEVDRERKL